MIAENRGRKPKVPNEILDDEILKHKLDILSQGKYDS